MQLNAWSFLASSETTSFQRSLSSGITENGHCPSWHYIAKTGWVCLQVKIERKRDSNLAGHWKWLVFISNTSSVCRRQTLRRWIMYKQQSSWQCLQSYIPISDKNIRITTTILVTWLVCLLERKTQVCGTTNRGNAPSLKKKPEGAKKKVDIVVKLEISLHIVLVCTDSTIHKYKDSKHGKRRMKNKHETKQTMLCCSVPIHDSPQCVNLPEWSRVPHEKKFPKFSVSNCAFKSINEHTAMLR